MAPLVARQRQVERDDAWWSEHARRWTEAGLITPEQAASLAAFESSGAGASAAAATAVDEVRLGPVAEGAAYVGTLLALIGAGIGLGPSWGSMHLAVRLTLAVALALVGFGVGTWSTRVGEAGTARLGGFLWMAAAGGVGLASGTIADEVVGDSPWMAVWIGAPVAAVGLGLWRNRERPLQLITAAIGMSLAVGGLWRVTGLPAWVIGIAVWSAAAALWVATLRVELHPTVLVRCLASAGAVAGALMLGDLSVRLGAGVALATATVVMVLAVRLRQTAVLVVGVLGASIAVQTLVQTTLHGPAGGAGLAVVGLVIVLAIALRSRRRPTGAA